MTRTTRVLGALTLAALMILLVPSGAMAQGTGAPKKGDMSVSGSLGFANAFEDEFDGVEPLFDGTFEYHVTDTLSWRGMVGFTSFDGDFGPFDVDVDVTFVNGNIVYSWNSDNLRPYVTGGVGFYNIDPSGPVSIDDDTEIGFNGGGGLDIYFDSHWALTVEGLFHGYSSDGPDSFLAATVGARYRF